MRVIVMAAGVGSRLSPLGHNRPKCLLNAAGETLISRLVRMCNEQGVTDISVVVGYQAELVERELDGRARCYRNPFFAQTNSLLSLWYARESLVGDVLLMNGDLFFEAGVLRAAIEQIRPVVMLADSSRIETADYRFGYCNGLLERHGKTLSDEETDAEYVGIARVDRSFMPRFRQRMEQLCQAERVNDWWEEVLYSFIPEGVPIHPHDVSGQFWTEVDCRRDYDRLQNWLGQSADAPMAARRGA